MQQIVISTPCNLVGTYANTVQTFNFFNKIVIQNQLFQINTLLQTLDKDVMASVDILQPNPPLSCAKDC